MAITLFLRHRKHEDGLPDILRKHSEVAVISGEVTADREAVVKLLVRGPGGAEAEVKTVLDTGFTEYLTLPPALIASWKPWTAAL